ncbi:MAG: sulfatase-like hydrolase/transferase [Polyangiaceae bacterium]|nr:sulfatase-like hydrolase/transferase [Polyangiaceae bacterium]
MTEPLAPERSLMNRWWRWAILGFFSAWVVAGIDFGLTAAEFPAAASDLRGAVFVVALLAGLYALVAVPVAAIAGSLDVPSVTRRLPSAPNLAAACLLAPFSALVITCFEKPLFAARIEFERPLVLLRFVLLAMVSGAVALAVERTSHICRRGVARWPRGTALGAIVALAVAGILLLVLAHVSFASIYQFEAAAGVTALAALAMTIALRQLELAPSRRLGGATAIGGGLLILLAVFVPGTAREHARFVVIVRGAGSATLATFVRDLFDRDGDGSAPSWVGGVDCREGDAAVGPGRLEIPGDGIDQDCRGGDAPLLDPPNHFDPGPPCGPRSERPSVLFIVVDTLRADAVNPETTPNLVELAAGSQRFSRAYSPTSTTETTFPAMLSGRPLSDTGAQNPVVDGTFAVDATIAERFREAGYRTAVFSDLDFHPFSLRGFAQRNPYWRDASVPNAKHDLTTVAMARGVLEFLSAGGLPAFVLMHIADVHAPYRAPSASEDRRRNSIDAYLAGVAYVDHHLGVFFRSLQRRDLLADTVLVLTADHGEELGARGREGHGANVFEEGVRVPLIVFAPGCRAGVFDQPVSTTRIGPTLGALAGIRVPGIGLFTPTELPTVTEGANESAMHLQRAVIVARHKLIVDVPNGGRMLFDLEADPGETRDLLRVEPDIAATLETAYQRWLDAPGRR